MLANPTIARGSTWSYWDRGGDLGTAWAATAFNASSWATGAGPLGYGEPYLATTVGYGPSASNKYVTTYFRAQFNVTDPALVTRILAEVMYDDGIVVFLNGTRIGSDFMPSGPSNGSTYALGHETGNAYAPYDWTAQRPLLVAGVNTIGVEVHQAAATSSDLTFDLSLAIETSSPPPPAGEDIARRATWSYWDRGGELGTAWRARTFDDVSWARGAGVLGYGEPYVNTTISYGGNAANKHRTTYFRGRFTVADPAAVTGLRGEVMYDDGVVIYVNGTRIETLSMPAGTITASTFALGHEAGNAYATRDWTAFRSALVPGDNVIAVEVHQDDAASSDLVFDLALDVTAGPPPPPTTAGIPRRATWRYQAGSTQPAGWSNEVYGDAAWPTGAAPLGYGEPYIATTIPYGPSASNKWVTTYFRKELTVADPQQIANIVGELMYDDGVVVWLNGERILSRGIADADGSVPWGAFGANREAGNAYETVPMTWIRDELKVGRNVIAVEVHQDDAGSSDLVFDFALRLDLAPPDASIARRALWSYWDNGGDLGTAWRTAPPSGWEAGFAPFTYVGAYPNQTVDWGNDPDHRHITTYFRRTFHVEDPAAVTTIRGELMYQDGAVVYVNGHEIGRFNMPSGPITASTLASDWHNGQPWNLTGSYEHADWTAAKPYLVPGDNVLAVEVHLSSPGADRFGFDAVLQVNTAATPRIGGCEPATPSKMEWAEPSFHTGFEDVWIAPSGVVWAVGETLIGRRATGGTWAWCQPATEGSWTGVWGTGDDDVWMAGDFGEVLRWNGSALVAVAVGGSSTWPVDVWGSSASNVFAVGYDASVRHFDGTTWQSVTLPQISPHEYRGPRIWGTSATDVWLATTKITVRDGPHGTYDPVSCDNQVYRRNPATGAFELQAQFGVEGTCHQYGLGGSGPNDVWAVGNQYAFHGAAGQPFAMRWNGTAWQRVEPPNMRGDAELTSVAAQGGGLWFTARSANQESLRLVGSTWTNAGPETSNLSAIDARSGAMFAVGAGFKVLRWSGTSWIQDR